ncbi:hypothetical protein JTB14_014444 [Gonioctena quinquepunctata]|nr:hypothetical protein JTB14_014444 [Gonioctena quinquepunctata]
MKLHKTVRLYTDKHLETIGTVFQTLYKDEVLTDCILYCKDGSVKAHKVILAASSRYFRKVFVDHKDDNAIFMYGISFTQLKYLIELIYKGSIDVSCDDFNAVFDLAEDLQVTGVLVEDGSNKPNGFGRDTRYKGQKRVAVDFLPEEQQSSVSKCFKSMERRSSSSSDKSSAILIKKDYEIDTDNEVQIDDQPTEAIDIDSISDGDKFVGHNLDPNNLSPWARKERKFKCDSCPSSFKRASHLSRHQLVHTGERPFACEQCDKAFSRHDKLKHHIHKSHELGALNDALGPDSLYTIDHVDILTPETSMIVEPEASILTHHHNLPSVSESTIMAHHENKPLLSISDITDVPQKKGRGRPRKHLPVLTVKRPRGRPRVNPIVAPPLVKRPRGRPRRLNPVAIDAGIKKKEESYTFANESYSDMEFLNKSDESGSEMLHNQRIMEPLVEIKTEPPEKSTPSREEEHTNSFFENIGLFENTAAIAKIGECTISVATNNSSGNSK